MNCPVVGLSPTSLFSTWKAFHLKTLSSVTYMKLPSQTFVSNTNGQLTTRHFCKINSKTEKHQDEQRQTDINQGTESFKVLTGSLQIHDYWNLKSPKRCSVIIFLFPIPLTLPPQTTVLYLYLSFWISNVASPILNLSWWPWFPWELEEWRRSLRSSHTSRMQWPDPLPNYSIVLSIAIE